jgi:alcohol dehydrogenase class IV
MKFTAPHCTKKFAKLAEIMGCGDGSEAEAANKSIAAMEAFIKKLDAHKTLKDLGVNEGHLDKLTEVTTNIMGKVLANNPAVPTAQEVKEMYSQCLI